MMPSFGECLGFAGMNEVLSVRDQTGGFRHAHRYFRCSHQPPSSAGWGGGCQFRSYTGTDVAQVSNLLYRRFPIGRAPDPALLVTIRDVRRLEALRYSRLETCA